MWKWSNQTSVLLVIGALQRYVAAIREDFGKYCCDSDNSEELDAAMRTTRTMRSATSILGSFVLNRIASVLEETLESIARGKGRLDDQAMVLVSQILAAIDSHLDNLETGLQQASGYQPENDTEMIAAVKAYRRFRGLPERDDAQAVSSLFATAPEFATARCGAAHAETGENRDASGQVSDGHGSTNPDDLAAELSLRQNVPPELWELFQEEGAEHIDRIYGALRELENDRSNQALIQEVRRSAHTLKGAAGAVGLRVVTQLAHRMEDLLDQLFAGDAELSADLLSLLMSTIDMLHDLFVGEIDEQSQAKLGNLYAAYDSHFGVAVEKAMNASAGELEQAVPEDKQQQPKEQSRDSAATAKQSPRKSGFVRVPTRRLEGLRRVVGELIVNRTSFGQGVEHLGQRMTELQSVLDMLAELCREVDKHREGDHWSPSAKTDDFSDSSPDNAIAEFHELEFDRFTSLDLWSQSLSEITSAIGSIRHDMSSLVDEFDSLLSQQNRLTLDTQNRLFQLEMVPLSTITPRLRRVMREVATQQGKDVELVIEGEDVELDKTVLDQLVEPLLHLLRNAVDHGIEPSEQRVQKQKPAKAAVRISLTNAGSQVVMRISDDGRGLDAEKIRAKAVQLGHVAEQELETLSDHDLYHYIFLPGFSTASSIGEISGRGVGMDVVHSKVEELEGRIEVDSARNKGTTFTIRLPVRLATIRTLMLKAGEQMFALPQHVVNSIIRVAPSEIADRGEGPRTVVDHRDCPLRSLHAYVGLKATEQVEAKSNLVAILGPNSPQVALQADEILPSRDVILQHLPNHLAEAAGLLGATVLSDGRIVPILDPKHLLGCQGSKPHVNPVELGEKSDRAPSVTIMIVDDSRSVRHVLHSIVERAGFTAVPARDGIDALEILASLSRPPDMFLLDVEMPRMDGFQLLRALRQEEDYAETPVIMITSRTGEKHRSKAMQFGATSYMTKPFQHDVLLETIQQLLP